MPIDVLVAGGGPAGAVTAALLAKEGVRVVLLERERHPRHHVGESLQPASMELLDRHLGLGPTLAAQGFAREGDLTSRGAQSEALTSIHRIAPSSLRITSPSGEEASVSECDETNNEARYTDVYCP